MEYKITIFHDTRRALKNGLYPVKLRVYSTQLKIKKLYPTDFEFSKSDFESIWETSRPRKNYQESRIKLEELKNKANKAAEETTPFSFEQFEKKLYRKVGAGEDVFYQYQMMIARNKKSGSIGNAELYELSLKSVKRFLKHEKGTEPKKLLFSQITQAWLKDYENYMLKTLGRSRTTLSIYTRSLRAVFNEAIEEKEIPPSVYPFGKKKYKIPKVRNVKKALSKEQLKKLLEAKNLNAYQEKARAFWFFSFSCNGMNIKDIAQLKYKDLDNDKVVYYRAKTINTSTEIKPIIIYLNEFTLSVIEQYGNKDKYPEQYIFSIINHDQNENQKHRAVKNFTRLINQHIKRLAISLELPEDISTYWARHSFATSAIRNGASMEFVSEAFDHGDLRTTKNYFAGFEEQTKKELAKSMMDF